MDTDKSFILFFLPKMYNINEMNFKKKVVLSIFNFYFAKILINFQKSTIFAEKKYLNGNNQNY